jgi:hypothetical protein
MQNYHMFHEQAKFKVRFQRITYFTNITFAIIIILLEK